MKRHHARKVLLLLTALPLLMSCERHRETRETYIGRNLCDAVAKWDFAPNRHFCDGMVAVLDTASRRYGFRNTQGRLVVPCRYEMAGDFHEGLARVTVDGRNGFIDKGGQMMIAPAFNRANNFSCGRAGVEQDGKWGFIDAEGNQVAPFVYDFAAEFSDSMAFVKTGGKYGYVDCSGTLVLPAVYELAYSFRDGVAHVKDSLGWKLIDKRGEKTSRLPKPADDPDGLKAVQKDGKWGYKDAQGNLVHPYLFDKAGEFHDGLAFVTLEGKNGIVDKNGFSTFNNRWKHARKVK